MSKKVLLSYVTGRWLHPIHEAVGETSLKSTTKLISNSIFHRLCNASITSNKLLDLPGFRGDIPEIVLEPSRKLAAFNTLNPLPKGFRRLSFIGGKLLEIEAAQLLYSKFPNCSDEELSDLLKVLMSSDEIATLAFEAGLDETLGGHSFDGGKVDYGNRLMEMSVKAFLGGIWSHSKDERVRRESIPEFCREFLSPTVNFWADCDLMKEKKDCEVENDKKIGNTEKER
ncbi:hypothetical protein G9A89_014840 [Geosiphon pyriformis]|nr:hypothetical protein G9A89_014840 [Geosiphon pyriformis]